MPEAQGTFSCKDGAIRDELGRLRIFHGANVSGRSKLPPFLPFEDPAFFDPLQRWGFNVVRLLLMWEALEPERGAFDHSYLARIRALAQEAGRRGMFVVIDLHQDLFSRVLGGDGAPPWAVTAPGPASTGRSWFYAYFTSRSVRRSQGAFWRNEDGIQDAFLDTCRQVILGLRDLPCVLGYDLWNEPMGDLPSVLGGAFEREQLAQFHRACIRLRDELDPSRLLFVEPSPLAAFGVPCRLPPLSGDNLVYAPHLYDGPAILAGRYMPKASTFGMTLQRVLATAAEHRLPTFIGEFGVVGDLTGGRRMILDQLRALDAAFVGWAVWHYNPSDIDWNDEDASIVAPGGGDRTFTDPLVRPYASALAGDPVLCLSDADTWVFRYRPRTDASTELVVPERWGGDAAVIDVDGASHRFVDADRVELEPSDAAEVLVRIRR